jgi:hypothetical protein
VRLGRADIKSRGKHYNLNESVMEVKDVELESVAKKFGNFVAVDDISLSRIFCQRYLWPREK